MSWGGPLNLTGKLTISAGDLQYPAGFALIVNGRSELLSPADGSWELTNNARTSFTRLQFGGTTSSFPAIQVSGTTLLVKLADGTVGAAAFQSPAYLTDTNCSSSASPAVCAAAAAGSAVIAAAATTVVVNTTQVTANSQIIVTEDQSLGTKLSVTCNTQSLLVVGTPRVTARTAATSFTVGVDVF